jgi:hypothetical protein
VLTTVVDGLMQLIICWLHYYSFYIASVKFEAGVGERCLNVPSLNELFLIVVSTIFELVVVL